MYFVSPYKTLIYEMNKIILHKLILIWWNYILIIVI
jgi:hypothetical protein